MPPRTDHDHDAGPVPVPVRRQPDLLSRPACRRADLRRARRPQLAPGRLRSARRLPGAAQGARRRRRRGHDTGAGDRRSQGIGAARPRRCRLSHRPEVELHAAEVHRAEVPGVQLRRRRTRNLQGSRHPRLQPAHRDRGHGDRRLRDGRGHRLQLHPRRDLRGLRPLRAGPGRGAGGGLSRSGPPGQFFQLPASRAPRLRRLHLRRGNRPARVDRRQEGPAAVQAAVPGERRPVRQADDDQQHRDLRRGAVDHPPRRPGVPGDRQAEQRRHEDLLGGRRRRAAGQLRDPARHAVSRTARAGRRTAPGPHAEGGDSGRIVGAGAAGEADARLHHGLRLDRQGRFDARLGRGDRHGRHALHGQEPAAAVVLLPARILRPVHAVPRGHRLAVAHGRPHRAWARHAGRHRCARFGGRQHHGAHDLRPRRCGGDAGARHDQALPRRVRAPRRTQDLHGRCHRMSTPMIELEIDGRKVSVPPGSMVMHATDALDIYVPHFCYHKKLTIAANCRMCLVEIEKTPKPMPACATPVAPGMVVRTKSDKALAAQKAVMEFLLINHPLDCPICDQGGECQLQDLAVGYGESASRYTEEKRVVLRKDVGPLVGMEEMTRCIHCTRCIRFGQEIGGVMELGMIQRGEHAEITTITGGTIDSELSGNMIDICPVGALTSKPFRYSARTWELARRRSVSPHDSTGANLIVQTKSGRVMRVVPFENEDVNECWIADRDRFSYEALNSDSRLDTPMIRQDGPNGRVWQAVDWTTALRYVAAGLLRIRGEFGAASIGALGTAHSTVEELHLLAKLVRGLGSESIDHRLRHADFGNLAPAGSARWLGAPIAALSTVDAALVIGSFLRKDHPLFAQRLRQAARKGARIHRLHALADDWLMSMSASVTAAPSAWLQALAGIAAAVAAEKGIAAPLPETPTEAGRDIARSLLTGEHKAVLLGNAAVQHPQASALLALASWIATECGASVGCLGEAANSVGAQLVNALPGPGGSNAGRMLTQGMKALLLLNVEPALDAADAAAASAALQASGLVVALTPFKDAAVEHADVLLPIAPFTETAGSFVNAEGRLQSFVGVVPPRAEARPAWKVLRVLGNLLGLQGFDFDGADEVRAEALGDATALSQRLDNRSAADYAGGAPRQGLERVADVPIYSADALVRRAASLQRTADARAPKAGLPQALWVQLGLQPADKVRLSQGSASIVIAAQPDPTLAPNTVRSEER